MLQTNYHWRGDSPNKGGAWHHYPYGHPDWSGEQHDNVDHTEIKTVVTVNGKPVKEHSVSVLVCRDCGVHN